MLECEQSNNFDADAAVNEVALQEHRLPSHTSDNLLRAHN